MQPAQTLAEKSGAFVETFELAPTADGPLAGLRFAVKDLIDVAGWRTGCGNPTWCDTHPLAAQHAVCVEQLLAAGAHCAGKTVTDELAFSLIGQNHFYGTPLNPRAPDRVPGGSSSGSASAVACGLCDFALGTDTGGSVRVPASNCGIWGLRPSHDFISVAGVMPFAPTFDTVGVLAGSPDVLARAAGVLLGARADATLPDDRPRTVYLLRDAFELADAEVRQALNPAVEHLRHQFGQSVRETTLAEICGDAETGRPETWCETYCLVQWGEIASSLSAWIAEAKPQFGPATAKSFELALGVDRRRVGPAIEERERRYRAVRRFLGPRDLLCFPTAPAPAPLKTTQLDRKSDYYRRALSLTSIAGIARLPQVSMPLGEVSGAPIGLSLAAAHGEDLFLLSLAQTVDARGASSTSS